MARRLLIVALAFSGLGLAALAQSRAGLPPAIAQRLDNSRVAMLPARLPSLPGVDALEQARAQALLDFLQSQRIYGQAGCDAAQDLCLPVFLPQDAAGPLPRQAAAILHAPLDGLLRSQDDSVQTYVAQAGALIFAPYDGTFLAASRLSGGRMLLSFQHDQVDEGRVISIITGQIETDFVAGDAVRKGQPIGRARPIRDASTRVTFALEGGAGPLNPKDWIALP